MELKNAVKQAKAYVADLFSEEPIANIALEEVERDDAAAAWRVTIGFNRTFAPLAHISRLVGEPSGPRVYRVVTITDDGTVRSVKRRNDVGD